MRFLADENIPVAVIDALTARGHDVQRSARLARGAADKDIVMAANRESRVLLTFDKDFGEIAVRLGLVARSGIILLRFVPRDPLDAATVVVSAVAARQDWAGHFAVVERARIRMRRLPGAKRS